MSLFLPTALITTHDPSEFAWICQFSLLPQVHASASRVLSCIECVGWGVGGGVGGVGWGGIWWDKNVIGTSTHTWCKITVRSLALHPYPYVRHAMPTGLMLRCKMSLALAHRLDATLQDVSCTCPPTWRYVVRCVAGCWIWWKTSCFVTMLDVRCGMFWES